ncbi:MAG: tetratricopeptide repeat protein, partial [Firmicutes bacterium]|nr:tetratricopeptide repeat protein [Bacillota bacterium]
MIPTIKIKNKYLIMLAVVVLLTVGAVSTYGGDILFSEAEHHKIITSDYAKALAYYDKLIEKYPDHPRIPDALYSSALLLPDTDSNVATIFKNLSTITHPTNQEELSESALTKQERLWMLYNKFPDHPMTKQGIFFLAEILKNKGNWDKAKELYLDYLYSDSFDYYHKQEAAFTLIDLLIIQGDPDKAAEIFDYTTRTFPGQNKIVLEMKRGDILLAQGDLENAEEAYNRVIDLSKTEYLKQLKWQSDGEINPNYIAMDMTEQYQKTISAKLATASSKNPDNVITGQVTLNGKPLSGIEVVLWNKPIHPWILSPKDSELISQFTNQNGEFEFPIAPENEYEVGIKLNSSQTALVEGQTLEILNSIVYPNSMPQPVEFNFKPALKLVSPKPKTVLENNAFTIEWELYPDASFYCVMIDPIFKPSSGGSSSYGGEPLYTEKNQITIEQIPFRIGQVGRDMHSTYPSYFLTPDALQIRVVACDQDGKPLTNSKGLYFGSGDNPSFVFAVKRDLQEEEQLIADRKFDEAVTALENRLKTDPNDTYALNLLSRIYFAGTYYLDTNFRSTAHRDTEKSTEMLERLVAIEPTAQNLRNLSTVYDNSNNPKGYDPCLLLAKRGENLAPSEYQRLAEYALWHEDNFLEAVDYYLITHKFSQVNPVSFPQNLVTLYVLLGKTDEALLLFENREITNLNEEKMKRLLEEYRCSQLNESGNYLSFISDSFIQSREIWQESDSAHSQFLYTLSELIKPNRYHERRELR